MANKISFAPEFSIIENTAGSAGAGQKYCEMATLDVCGDSAGRGAERDRCPMTYRRCGDADVQRRRRHAISRSRSSGTSHKRAACLSAYCQRGVEIFIDVTGRATAKTKQRGSRRRRDDWMAVVGVLWSVSVR